MKRNQRVVSILFAFLLIFSSILSPISTYAENTQEKESENVTPDEELEDKREKESIQEKSTNDSEIEKENAHKQDKKEKSTDQDHTLSVETEDEEQSNPDEATEEEEEIQTKERAPPVTVNVRVETHEKTLVPSTEVTVDNFDLSEYGGPASTDSPRTIHAIIRALENVEHLDLTNYNDFALEFDGNYIAGIDGLFEFDAGGNSGWMYFIDNGYVEKGVLQREINDGESIVLFYTPNYTDNTFSWFDRESYSTQVGESLEIELTGINFDVVNPVEGASILIDEKEYIVDGEKVLTDENGKITVQFDEPGTYHLSAQRINANDERNIVRPYAIVEVTENNTDEKNKGNEEIDTEPPVITVEGIKDKETVTEEDITFTVDASDDVDGQIEPVVTVNGHNIQPKESNTYATTLDEGTNTIVIEATDSSDNYATKQYNLFYDPTEQDDGYDIENRIDKAADYILSKGIVSEWEAIGLARAGKEVPEDYRETLKNNIHSQITTRLPGRVKITDIERLAIAAVAIGEDPRDIEKHDLIDLIYNSPLRGSFDTMTFQGNNGPIFALIALDTLNFEEPFDAKWTRQKLIEELLNNQNPDGSWALNSTFPTPSVDVSAMAIIALAPYKEQPKVKRAIEGVLDYLSSVQNDEGGFTESFVGGTSSEATSQAIIGLTAYGLAPTDERFTKNGNNLIDHLLTYQNEDGGFGHLPGDRTNSMATEQALQALVAYDLYLKDQGRLYEFGGSKDNPDKDAAQEVVNKINELPSPQKITLNDQEKVEKVRKDYDALTDDQKQFVSNLSKLEALETKLEELEKQLAEDVAIAKALDEKINALPSVDKLTLEDKDSVVKVRQSFDKLTDEQKLIVSNLSKLESLEAKIEKLEKQLAEDKAAAKELDKKITALPNVQELSLADKRIVSEVRQAYEELTETQKSFVENISHLETLETKIKELEKQLEKDKAAAKTVDEVINSLPDVKDLTIEDKEDVSKARQAYEGLTNTQKTFVTSLTKLKKLENKMNKLMFPIDKTELEKLLTEAKNKQEAKYTKESFKKLQNAISLAEKIQAKENATEKEVDEVINVLAEAIEGLVILKKSSDPNPEKTTNPNPEELPKPSLNGGEGNGENGSNGTNDDSTNEFVNNGKPTSDLTAKDESVKKLPSTATQIYNLLLTGFVLIVFASILLYFNKRREVK